MTADFHTTRLAAENRCPFCAGLGDAASSPDGATPIPGDISVCAYCFGVLQFDAELRIVACPPEVLAGLSAQERADIDRIRAALKLMKGPST